MAFQSADYRALCAEVDKEFLRGTVGAEQEQMSNWQEIAREKKAATGKVVYAQGNNAPKMLPKGGAYDFAELAVNTYAIKSNRYGRGIKIEVDDLTDDKYGVFMEIIADLGAATVKLPQTLVWSWLLEGDQTTGPASTLFTGRDMTGIDGVAFFSASHKVNINDAALSTQSNLTTSSALTGPNYEIARAQLVNMKNTEGQPIGRQPTHIYVPPQLVKTAADILYTQTISTGGDNTQGNAMGPALKRPKMTIVEVPELSADSTKWYLGCKSDLGAPITWQVTEDLHIVPKIDPQSDNRFYDDTAEWLAKGRVEVGWGDYRRIVRHEA